MSTTGVITATGTKGFLQWLKTYQPDVYAYVSPKLVASVKSQNQHAAMSGLLSCVPMRMSGLGDGYSNYVTSYQSSPLALDTSGSQAAINDLVIPPSSTTNDAASVASSNPTSAALATTISSLANAYSSAVVGNAQVQANNTLLQTNLARAQQGLAPLTMTGQVVGGVTLGSSSSTMLLIGAAVLAAFALGGKKNTP